MYLLASALETQGALSMYDDLLVRSEKTEQNNVARMGEAENKNHWSDNRKRTGQFENTNRRQKVKCCSVRELNMFTQDSVWLLRLWTYCLHNNEHTYCIECWKFTDQLRNCKLCIKDNVQWSSIHGRLVGWLVNRVHHHTSLYTPSLTSQWFENNRNISTEWYIL